MNRHTYLRPLALEPVNPNIESSAVLDVVVLLY
jgi:hypothetical protein